MSYRTIYQREVREERRRCGLCVYCGQPAILKADGTYARRCENCRDSHQKQKTYAKHSTSIAERQSKVRKKTHAATKQRKVCKKAHNTLTYRQVKIILNRLNKEKQATSRGCK